ncbi:Hypothetical protein PEIBARAKI_6990 [Petrimonas sp. IBARAKI]|nr:Hypothetical protein PEIBARAKI_6990 [Petrimonas sp. IBARAKI]
MKKVFLLTFINLFVGFLQSQNATKLVVLDTRNVNSIPSYYQLGTLFEFKLTSSLNAPGTSMYGGLITVAPWKDPSGNKNHQLFLNDNGLFYRTGIHGQTTWEPWQKILIQNSSGQVGINTSNTRGYTLAVNGNILAKEIKIETGWADFVFDKDYQLPTLAEVERHIREKGHLQGIPSEIEVKENGVNLGEMNIKLLQKVEELTLYLIGLDREYKTLKQEIEILKNKVTD